MDRYVFLVSGKIVSCQVLAFFTYLLNLHKNNDKIGQNNTFLYIKKIKIAFREGFLMKKFGKICILIACLIVVTINAGCLNQTTTSPRTVAGTSGLQVNIEKNVTVNQAQYKDFDTGKIVVSPPIARFSLNIIFANTGNSPVNLENYMYKLYLFDPKFNAYQEIFSGTGIGLGLTTLEPGSNTQSAKLNTYIGATLTGWCSQKEQYKFEIKKGGIDTMYSTEFTILPSDCDNIENYHNGNMDPNDYKKYIDSLKTKAANK